MTRYTNTTTIYESNNKNIMYVVRTEESVSAEGKPERRKKNTSECTQVISNKDGVENVELTTLCAMCDDLDVALMEFNI